MVSGQASFEDRADFENADRGLIATLTPGVIKNQDGRVVWDADAYRFLDGDCPGTASPSLWRQGQLTLTKPQLLGMLATHTLDGIDTQGDPQALQQLLGLLDTSDKQFAIVTP
jgi:alkyl sulfatase BDS1-like metallo-beta-lactamase superfamily hydrolase